MVVQSLIMDKQQLKQPLAELGFPFDPEFVSVFYQVGFRHVHSNRTVQSL